MVHSETLTAEALLGAPRRSAAVPNANGTLALYTLSTHDFQEDKTVKELKVMELETTRSRTITLDDKIHDALWIPGSGDEVVVLKSLESGHTQVVLAPGRICSSGEAYIAAEIPAPVSALKLKALEDGDVAFVVAGLVGKDGKLFNDVAAKPRSTGRIFDTANIRVWTELRKEQRYSLWYSKLQRDGARWTLATELINLVPSDSLEAPPSMYDGEPTNDFDVGTQAVVFLAKDLSQRRPEQTLLTNPYCVTLQSFILPPGGPPQLIERLDTTGSGMGANIRIAPDDDGIGFLYAGEADLQDARLFYGSIETLCAIDILASLTADSNDDDDDDDRFPLDGFEFLGNHSTMLLKSTRCGRDAISYICFRGTHKPQLLFHEGSVSAFHAYTRSDGSTQVLLSNHSFLDSSLWQVLHGGPLNADPDPDDVVRVRPVSSLIRHGAMFGLGSNMVSEFWFHGADEHPVHAWMIRPSGFDEDKKYPWVLMPHGGPISSWQDAWSTRWNAAAWAQQGYVIILPNVSGSTGFGLKFTKRVEGEWGGNPFQDLLHLLDHLKQLPFLDPQKAVLAGASYGGYLVSWFFGHPIIKEFCCAVWHDGIFSLPSFSLQSDLLLNNGGNGPSPYPWLSAAEMARWNPAAPERLRHWAHAPPTLVIASERDYRCPITEGLAAFTALQGLGVPSRFLTFTDEGHWVLREENALVWHRTVWEWVRRCVSGEISRASG